MENELLQQISLSFVPNIGAVQAKILVDHFGDASSIFKARATLLATIEGIGEVRAASIKAFRNFKKAETEISFIEKFNITPLFLTSKGYPKRLLNCYDPPTILYYRGTADLNMPKIISVIGTRNNTIYGKQLAETFLSELCGRDILVVSGLAFGIDAIAHKAALKNDLPTVGVLAHGLRTIYPSEHTSLAKEMMEQGGILTEFTSNIKPDRHHFPTRNRIVAGISDAVIVIETGIKGGSMITAGIGNDYNKDVFAFPGRTTDSRSTGCNYLIKNNKAMLIADSSDLLETMGWIDKKKKRPQIQRELFQLLSDEEKIILALIAEKEKATIDELNLRSKLCSSKVAATVLGLELKGLIVSLPGKLYQLL